jgi:polycomb protein EED
MASSKSSIPTEWDFPRLRTSFFFQNEQQYPTADPQEAQGMLHLPQLAGRWGCKTDSPLEFFDVKFYPYNPPGAPPIFAATSKKHVGSAPSLSSSPPILTSSHRS